MDLYETTPSKPLIMTLQDVSQTRDGHTCGAVPLDTLYQELSITVACWLTLMSLAQVGGIISNSCHLPTHPTLGLDTDPAACVATSLPTARSVVFYEPFPRLLM